MLIDYATLKDALAADTLDNLCREYLVRQIGDEGFDQTDSAELAEGVARVQRALARGELVVEYSEADESVAIRRREELVQLDHAGN
ncbi:YheU family protein [Ferrimonas balearica]|uniref:YheU family protein n=1 Tax=Ferrimonas balearica TaxID=44012 RepID=UPI001C99FA90|nr:YheU family protein [Ferrimonas balearica]MBY5922431.1 YheU family protein [Ferrimonas balearica]MBY5995415.1 YheU family protein [Ferrimonas balearica]